MSSSVETTGAPVPTVPTLMAGRAAILPVCTSPEISTPSTTDTQAFSFIQVELSSCAAAVVAAKISPPMLGRMKVWMVSLIVSTAGILSRMTSASSRAAAMPMAQVLSIHS